ncbi:uracil-DNA glycosylase family protein [Acinetobacter rathckeae]|uniref:uracil-DNA glycosylase family protein n=1 Tax=Acinetobacter rathckeae TaxID=2605272 RepID=UPI0018A30622|nr:uracil-DNA glycosylase family protein [Acinetobacter rathckeae]MBF7687613.1 uracil-DNA glycosylase family protein [Acinetobacter rathckeae]MBF7695015.1 uracil-DNA glycosylase family protein [Acinetobacter rathckeae]
MQDIETHPLDPFLPSNTKILLLGSFPPPKDKWKMDFYYPNYQNDMWRIMGLIFFNDKHYFINTEQKNFHLDKIKTFLQTQNIGIFDTAFKVIRKKQNASDLHLHVVEPTNLLALLKKIPNCHTIMTTGEKATQAMMLHFKNTPIPKIGKPSQVTVDNRSFGLYRLPSSSRAYPLALEKKVEAYRQFFLQIQVI